MQDLFFFDIETCGVTATFNEFKTFDERGASLFQSKYNKMGWEEKWGSIEEAWKENAGIISTYGKICCISCGFLTPQGEIRITSFSGDDEREIVNQFNDLLKRIQSKPYNLCGYRIVNFDIPWVLHKLHKYGIQPAEMIYLYDKKPWEVRARDLSEDWKSKFAWSYSFDEVCYELGIDSPKEKLDGSKVHEAYHRGEISKIKDYCERDVRASIEVAKKIYKK